ncbi:MAG TPA: hypothetical protein VFR07_14200 [Mycobacteriales bacterium]|jgi:quercetin dioxygenase-like cupin family protein|nr:hypothetical protein [Mycobacteriales bacterium]
MTADLRPAEPGTTGPPDVRLARDSPLLTVYAWERWGNFINTLPGSDVEIPYDAARLQVKLYPYPAGEIRVLRFHPDVRTHDHVNKTDTILYEWTARRVQFANHDAAVCDPGDLAFHPKGVFHHGEVLTPGLAVEFAMEATTTLPDPTATWLASSAMPFEPAAAWSGPGGVVEVLGPHAERAAQASARYEVRGVQLGPYVVREVRLPRGTVQPVCPPDADLLWIVLSGRLRLAVHGQSHELGVEDTGWAPRGTAVTREALEDVVLLEALIPTDR